MRKQFHMLRKFGRRMQSVVAMGYESAAAVLLILLAPVLTEGSNS